MAANQETTITLTQICCVQHSAGIGSDDVFLYVIADNGMKTRYPAKGDGAHLTNGECWKNIDLTVSFKEQVQFQLYDNDKIGEDFLVTQTYYANQPIMSQSRESNPDNGAVYDFYAQQDE